MKAIILAAWYATRLFPLTKNFPKPLIKIAGKTMLDYLIDKILDIWIDEIFVVTNNKYFKHFMEWNNNAIYDAKIKILNDKTLSNEDRLWAIWDINFVLEHERINDDIFVVCGDNLFEFSLENARQKFEDNGKTTIVGYDVQDFDIAKKLWIIAIDEDNLVIDFIEKPENPPSTLASTCMYFYPRNVVKLFKEYLEEWNNKDAPWNFLARLIEEDDVYAEIYSDQRYDVWSFESLKAAKESFGEENVDIEALKNSE